MKKYSFFGILILLLLTACGPKAFTLNGESDMWIGKLKVTNEGDYEDLDFVLHYKGEDKSDVDHVSYSVTHDGGSFSGEEKGLREGANLLSGSTCNGCAGINQSDVVVSVEWNEKTEEFELD